MCPSCIYACSCKDSQKDSTRARSDKRVDVVHATRRRKYILSLGTINTEASKLGEGCRVRERKDEAGEVEGGGWRGRNARDRARSGE